jgi:exodeoxyribonuclease VII large subunit
VTTPSSPEAPWPVRTVARKIADWIGRLGEVWVEGQVAQLSRRGGAATVFLTLRDPAADLSVPVTCHRDVAERPGLELTEGARVIVRARPDYYVARGSFSLRATEIRAVGLGELLARIERVRRLLAAEGLFDAARKRPLPFAPAVVGVITGRDSAAERDVLVTARRRWPAVRFEMYNCAVQGPTAAASVMEGLRRMDADPDVEVIVIARGGGSVEDLLPFSDEGLVRAIAATRTPVVTAVGHETDTTLVDHVADVRAATPTDAAHRVVPEIGEQRRLVDGLRSRARQVLAGRLEQQVRWLESVRTRPVLASPDRLLHGREEDVLAL